MNVDAIVLAVCCAGFALVIGMNIGEQAATERIATTCHEQPGERLVATHVTDGMVICVYNNGYGRVSKSRRAS
jgi:hypothetical protein